VYEYGTPEYEKLVGDKRQPGSRAVIVVDIHKVGTVSDGLPVVPVIMSGNLLLLRSDL